MAKRKTTSEPKLKPVGPTREEVAARIAAAVPGARTWEKVPEMVEIPLDGRSKETSRFGEPWATYIDVSFPTLACVSSDCKAWVNLHPVDAKRLADALLAFCEAAKDGAP